RRPARSIEGMRYGDRYERSRRCCRQRRTALRYSTGMYHGQVKQDQFLNENLFKNQKGGFFVDVGAHNGLTINNTLFFEQELGWHGICIEPIPGRFKELAANRNCEVLRGCAYDRNMMLPFTKISGHAEMLSGIGAAYPDAELQVVRGI